MPQQYKKTTIVYGENKLQITFKIPLEVSTESAQDLGMAEMRKLLDKLEVKGMPHIELDPACTDFYPGNPSSTSVSAFALTLCDITQLFLLI